MGNGEWKMISLVMAAGRKHTLKTVGKEKNLVQK